MYAVNALCHQKTGVGYITVSGFVVTKAATTWAPPAAYQGWHDRASLE